MFITFNAGTSSLLLENSGAEGVDNEPITLVAAYGVKSRNLWPK